MGGTHPAVLFWS